MNHLTIRAFETVLTHIVQRELHHASCMMDIIHVISKLIISYKLCLFVYNACHDHDVNVLRSIAGISLGSREH